MPRKTSKRKKRTKKDIYCGNNGINRDLVNGNKVIGTRYTCMKKGVGIGLNMPVDPDYLSGYVPIDSTRVYCGNARRKPQGYDRMGNNPECLRKGVGQGKLIKARRQGAGASFSFDDNVEVTIEPYKGSDEILNGLSEIPEFLFFIDSDSGNIFSVMKDDELEFWNGQKEMEFIKFSVLNNSFNRNELKKVLEGSGNVFVLSEK